MNSSLDFISSKITGIHYVILQPVAISWGSSKYGDLQTEGVRQDSDKETEFPGHFERLLSGSGPEQFPTNSQDVMVKLGNTTDNEDSLEDADQSKKVQRRLLRGPEAVRIFLVALDIYQDILINDSLPYDFRKKIFRYIRDGEIDAPTMLNTYYLKSRESDQSEFKNLCGSIIEGLTPDCVIAMPKDSEGCMFENLFNELYELFAKFLKSRKKECNIKRIYNLNQMGSNSVRAQHNIEIKEKNQLINAICGTKCQRKDIQKDTKLDLLLLSFFEESFKQNAGPNVYPSSKLSAIMDEIKEIWEKQEQQQKLQKKKNCKVKTPNICKKIRKRMRTLSY